MAEEHNILIVDDDQALCETLRTALSKEGFEVDVAATGQEALEHVELKSPALVILDIALAPAEGSQMDGIEVLQHIRASSSAGVLMLTATSVGYVKVSALELGADDYLTKPFNTQELLARVKAILRRTTQAAMSGEVLEFDGLRIDPNACRVWKGGDEVDLTAIEFDILLALARHPGQVMRRTQLINQAWSYRFMGDERLVDVHIGRIRKKIEETPSKPKRIVTVWGKGYRFETSAEEAATAEDPERDAES